MSHIRYIRRPEVLARAGVKNSALHQRIRAGLFVPPVSLGSRAVGWLEHEVEQALAAIAAGKSDEALRTVVRELVESRQQLERKGVA